MGLEFRASVVDIYVFHKILFCCEFYIAISLMKTRSPDDHPCHAVFKRLGYFFVRFTVIARSLGF